MLPLLVGMDDRLCCRCCRLGAFEWLIGMPYSSTERSPISSSLTHSLFVIFGGSSGGKSKDTDLVDSCRSFFSLLRERADRIGIPDLSSGVIEMDGEAGGMQLSYDWVGMDDRRSLRLLVIFFRFEEVGFTIGMPNSSTATAELASMDVEECSDDDVISL